MEVLTQLKPASKTGTRDGAMAPGLNTVGGVMVMSREKGRTTRPGAARAIVGDAQPPSTPVAVHRTRRRRAKLLDNRLEDERVDLFEVNEAFAAQRWPTARTWPTRLGL